VNLRYLLPTFCGLDAKPDRVKRWKDSLLAKVDPFAWFQDVLIRIGECSMQQLDELLPHRWAAARH